MSSTGLVRVLATLIVLYTFLAVACFYFLIGSLH